MQILYPTNWKEYEFLDSGNGKRLERFGKYTIVRPDPQCIWKPLLPSAVWTTADAVFKRSEQDKGQWTFNKTIPKSWTIQYKDMSFSIKLSSFKHTGIFPEQAIMWDFIQERIQSQHTVVSLLNLFGYTGCATVAAASVGAKVTHVDASRPTISWARENQQLSRLTDKPIRWIVDDVVKFCQREVKRGNTYDAIIMDPPVYGHGPHGQIWKFTDDFPQLLTICKQLLSSTPLFVIVNAYAISASSLMIANVMEDFFKDSGRIEYGELALQQSGPKKRLLSTGIFGRWSTQ